MGIEIEALVPGLDYVWDPNTGTFYINRTGWPAAPYGNLHAEMWVFDAGQSYPCETAQAMRALIDKVCEGYVEGETGGTTASLSFAAVNELGETTDDSKFLLYAPSVYLEGGLLKFATFAVDAENPPLPALAWLGSGGHTWTGKFVSVDSETERNYLGVDWYIMGDTPAAYYYNLFKAFSTVGMLKRGGKDAIKDARINVEIGAGVLATYKRDYKLGEYDTTDAGESTDLSAVKLRCIIVKDNGDGTYSYIGNSGLSPTGTLAPFVVDEVTYYRGTLDCTALLKAAYDLFTTDSNLLLLFTLAPESATGAATTGIGTAMDWIAEWSATFDEESKTVTELHVETRTLTYGFLRIFSLMVQFDPDYLSGGPNLHFDSTGHVAMPDLMYEP